MAAQRYLFWLDVDPKANNLPKTWATRARTATKENSWEKFISQRKGRPKRSFASFSWGLWQHFLLDSLIPIPLYPDSHPKRELQRKFSLGCSFASVNDCLNNWMDLMNYFGPGRRKGPEGRRSEEWSIKQKEVECCVSFKPNSKLCVIQKDSTA